MIIIIIIPKYTNYITTTIKGQSKSIKKKLKRGLSSPARLKNILSQEKWTKSIELSLKATFVIVILCGVIFEKFTYHRCSSRYMLPYEVTLMNSTLE